MPYRVLPADDHAFEERPRPDGGDAEA